MALQDVSLIAFLNVLALELILSADNALVIAMVAQTLPKRRRALNLLQAGMVIYILRLTLTAGILIAAQWPGVHILCAMLIVWVALRLPHSQQEAPRPTPRPTQEWRLLATIILADAITSMENVVVAAAAADHNLLHPAMAFAITVPLMLTSSSLIARQLDRRPWLLWLGAAFLAFVAAKALARDPLLEETVLGWGPRAYLIYAATVVAVLGVALWQRRRDGMKSARSAPGVAGPP